MCEDITTALVSDHIGTNNNYCLIYINIKTLYQ